MQSTQGSCLNEKVPVCKIVDVIVIAGRLAVAHRPIAYASVFTLKG